MADNNELKPTQEIVFFLSQAVQSLSKLRCTEEAGKVGAPAECQKTSDTRVVRTGDQVCYDMFYLMPPTFDEVPFQVCSSLKEINTAFDIASRYVDTNQSAGTFTINSFQKGYEDGKKELVKRYGGEITDTMIDQYLARKIAYVMSKDKKTKDEAIIIFYEEFMKRAAEYIALRSALEGAGGDYAKKEKAFIDEELESAKAKNETPATLIEMKFTFAEVMTKEITEDKSTKGTKNNKEAK